MKEKILELLRGDSLDGFLKGIELFEEHAGTPELPDAELDQEIMERACSIYILEKWVGYEDYIQSLQKFIDAIPAYASHPSYSEISYNLKGISVFINGLIHSTHDISGFLWASHSGYQMSKVSANTIKEFFESEKDAKSAAFFNEIYDFFDRINKARWSMGAAIRKIKVWNEPTALGFFYILTDCDTSNMDWMMIRLDDAIEDPMVKEHIFGKFLGVLKKVEAKYKKDNDAANLEQIRLIKKMVITRSKGK